MNYSEEEKEAIEYIEQLLYIKKEYKYIIKVKSEDNTKQSLQTVLNLIQKQESIIDKMAEELYFDCWDRVCQECCKECEKDKYTQRECIKEYFKKVVGKM